MYSSRIDLSLFMNADNFVLSKLIVIVNFGLIFISSRQLLQLTELNSSSFLLFQNEHHFPCVFACLNRKAILASSVDPSIVCTVIFVIHLIIEIYIFPAPSWIPHFVRNDFKTIQDRYSPVSHPLQTA